MSTEPVTHLEQVVAGTTTPVTHLAQVVAGTAPPVTHLEHVISENSGGGEAVLIQKTITANGTFAAADDNADGFSSVTVEVEGGGEKTLTKLADVTITEPVRVVEITVTEAIRSCQMFYFVNSGVVFSEDDWLAYIINNVPFFCKQKTTTQPDYTRPFCITPACTINGVSYDAKPMDTCSNGDDVYIATNTMTGFGLNNGITSFKISSYTGNTDLTAGHFEIWGWV